MNKIFITIACLVIGCWHSAISQTSCSGQMGGNSLPCEGTSSSYFIYSGATNCTFANSDVTGTTSQRTVSGSTITWHAAGTYTIYFRCSCGTIPKPVTVLSPTTSPGTIQISDGDEICPGQTGVTITASSGSIVRWERMLNNQTDWDHINYTGNTLPSQYVDTSIGGQYRALRNGNCGSTGYSPTAVIQLTSFQGYFLGGGGTWCHHQNITLELSGSESGTTYELLRPNGTVFASRNGSGSVLQWENVSAADGSGTYRVRATKNGCSTLMTSGADVTFVAPATVYDISLSATSFCTGSPAPTITLSGSQDNYVYKLYRNGVVTNQSKTGNGSPLSFTATQGGEYTIRASWPNCNETLMNGTAIVTEITPFADGGTAQVSPTGVICPDGSSAARTITVSGINGTVVHWERLLSGESQPSIFPTSSTTFPSQHIVMNQAGVYTALIEGTCSTTDYSSPAVIELEQFTYYFLEGGGDYCYSANVVLELTGSQSGTKYELMRPDGTVHGTGMYGEGGRIQWIDVNYQDGSGTFWVKATRGTCSQRVTTSGAVVNFSAPPLAKEIEASHDTFCSEGPFPTVYVLATEDNSITYRLYRDGQYDNQSKPGNNGTVSFTVTEGGRFTVEAVRTGCVGVPMNGYVDIAKYLTPPTPSIGEVNQYCAFSIARKSESGHSNWYWLPNENTFDESNNNDTKRVNSTSYVYLGAKGSNGCWKVVSELVTVEDPLVNLAVTPSSSDVCHGGKVTLTASGADFYIWRDNAGNVMHESAVFETPMLTSSRAFTVTGYDTKGCYADFTQVVNVWPRETLIPDKPFLTKTGATYSLNKNNLDNSPAGFQYYWQTSPEGEGLSLSSDPLLSTQHGVYYLRARNSNGCWGPSVSIELPDLTAPVYAVPLNNQNVNYVRTYAFQHGGISTSDPELLSTEQAVTNTSYLDGLGRAIQQVSKKGSPSKTDLVEPIDYDAFGRTNRRFLPYSSSSASGDVQSQPFTAQRSFYETAAKVAHSDVPLSYIDYEDSPLNRSESQLAPGESWVGTTGIVGARSIKNEVQVNLTADQVIKFEVISGNLSNTGPYAERSLVKSVTWDENHSEVLEFRNKTDQVVLKRVKASETAWANTYYVYDEFGNLRFVLPPELIKNIGLVQQQPYTPSQDELDNFAFQYKYDARKRMTEKKIPGAEWVYMVYDPRDRLVATQDGNQRATSPYQWTFTKYDELNRPILTGIKDTAVNTQVDMQNGVTLHYSKLNAKWGETYSDSGPVHGYSNHTYPVFTTGTSVDPNHFLTVTYYDNYDFRDQWLDDYSYTDEGLTAEVNGIIYTQPSAESTRVTGQITGSKIKVLDGGPRGRYSWLKTANYFDHKYRVVQSVSDNYKGGQDNTTNLYDFTGKLLKTKLTHSTNEISWTDLVNTETVGNNLVKTLLSNGWSAGAVTAEQLPAGTDGWIECIISETNHNRAFGLTQVNEGENYTTIDYAFWHSPTSARIYENGSLKYTFPQMVESGDVIRIERAGTNINYYKNGVIIRTTPNAPTGALIGDASISTSVGNIVIPRASFASKSNVITKRYVYDHAGRLIETWHQINTEPEVRITYNEYNELGELVDKKLHSKEATASDAVQSVDFRYNIRGWLTAMNDVDLGQGDAGDPSDYFSYSLAYETLENGIGNTPMFNGNISAMQWTSNLGLSEEKVRAYTYSYDGLSRLTSAAFKSGTGTPSSLAWSTPTGNAFATNYEYDLNGNIKGLVRKGKEGSPLDNLVYDYGSGASQSNQLLSVTDSGLNDEGFTEIGADGLDYEYDDNGNLVWDKNKGGEEVLQNAEFSNGNAGWTVTDTGGRLTFQNGDVDVTTHATASATIRQDNIILQRAMYVVVVDVVRQSGNFSINIGNGGNKWIAATGKTVFTYKAGGGDDFVVTIPTTFSGQIKSIEVKGIVVISYNYLNLPEQVVKGRQQSLGYIYDATGRKLSQEVYDTEGKIVKKSDYEGEFFYENDELVFVNHDEGRAVMSEGTPEYQYHLKDHLGNVRLTFTTKPQQDEYVATMEDNRYSDESPDFPNYEDVPTSSVDMYNHTVETGATKSVVLNGAPDKQVGLAKSIRVVPGDIVDMKVYAKYYYPDSQEGTGTFIADAITSAFGLSSSSVGYEYSAFEALNDMFSTGWVLGPSDWEDANAAKVFLNYILFDDDFVPYDMGWDQVDISAAVTQQTPNPPHDSLELQAVATKPGYVYIYFSNEEQGDVVEAYFDDLSIVHKHGPVIQADDYYPFGWTFNTYSRENATSQEYKYNGKEDQNELSLGWLDYGVRMFDPVIARWMVVDPAADLMKQYSPYVYSFDNPVRFIDKDGMIPDEVTTDPPDLKAITSGPKINMDGGPRSKLNAAGHPRSGPYFWKQMLKAHPEMFSDANKAEIAANRSPRIDDQWIDFNPSHAAYKGDQLIHHHVDQGNMAVGIPKEVHDKLRKQLHHNTGGRPKAGANMGRVGMGLGLIGLAVDVFSSDPHALNMQFSAGSKLNTLYFDQRTDQYFEVTERGKETDANGVEREYSVYNTYQSYQYNEETGKYEGVNKLGTYRAVRVNSLNEAYQYLQQGG